MENKKPVAVEAKCWGCGKIWNITLLVSANAKGVRCPNCGEFVITDSGKAMLRWIYDEWEATSPLLEEGDWEEKVKNDVLGKE